MLSKIALNNLKEKKTRSLLALLTIIISIGALSLFLGLSNGIKTATFEELEKQNPLTQITIRPNLEGSSGLASLFSKSKEGSLTDDTIDEIKKIDNVEAIYPEIQFNNFASLEASLLGFDFITDTMIFGVPYDFIKQEVSSQQTWQASTEPYPTLIPRKLLDLYNIGIAYPQNIPTVSEENLLGKELTLYPNYSTFFPGLGNKKEEIKLEVVGFSDKISLLGATLPFELVQKLNQQYSTTTKTKYLELFVETSDPTSTTTVAQKIEELGFSTQYYQKNLKEVEAKFTYLTLSLGIISLIILVISGIAIISTFLATIAERTREIGLFRALGATKSDIKIIILFEAGIIGLIGGIIGSIFGLISSYFLDGLLLKELEKTSFNLDSLFSLSPLILLTSALFGVIISILSAYLPAQKASNINPIEALKS